MKRLDVWLQDWRIAKVRPHLSPGAVVLDVGSADGALFRDARVRALVDGGLGIDPSTDERSDGRFRSLRGLFPDDLPPGERFDVITAMAVLEHVPPEGQVPFAKACCDALREGGRLILTVPSPLVDRIIDALKILRLLDGMADEEHYGFDPSTVVPTFTSVGFALAVSKGFQLGLNHLYVFEKPAG